MLMNCGNEFQNFKLSETLRLFCMCVDLNECLKKQKKPIMFNKRILLENLSKS